LRKFTIRSIRNAPCSPDLALSDFCPLAKLKGAFGEREFVSTADPVLAITDITGSIERAEIESVFDAWELRLGQLILMKGECVSWGKSQNHRRNLLFYSQAEMPKNNCTPDKTLLWQQARLLLALDICEIF
jgi:hypothetical protein